MPTQLTFADSIRRGAEFSPCRTWRYALTRIWDDAQPPCVFIGLNPSTADELLDDPTIRRCMRYARDWGHGGLVMLNLFGLRGTNPKCLLTHADPVGPENDARLRFHVERAARVVAAWGAHQTVDARWENVKRKRILTRTVYCLGRTKHDYPRHPLYVRADVEPAVFLEGES